MPNKRAGSNPVVSTMNKRTIIIGDVHGCLDELIELLEVVGYSPNTEQRLILLGDLMDRGPDPVGVVRYARSISAECVLGNHDDKHLRWRKHEARQFETGKSNPMKMASLRVEQNAQLSIEDVAWLSGLPRVLRVDPNWALVHGGFQPQYPVEKQDPKRVICMRYLDDDNQLVALDRCLEQPEGSVFWTERWKGPESVVYGHAVHDLVTPRIDEFPGGRCIGIDTGCCYGGMLTAFIPEEDRFVQVQGKRNYATWHKTR